MMGPTKNPTKPTPETNEMLFDAEMLFVFPANLNNSGMTTESPKPIIPKPIALITN